ncbi:MAG: Flp family type IVb pilin [Pseudomonadota bacterium]|nr:Flp family type IVb pilin [Pseudomonadota bacterium]
MKTLHVLKPRAIRRFLLNESGATSIEYAIIAAGVAGVLIVVVYSLGGGVKDLYDKVTAAYTG